MFFLAPIGAILGLVMAAVFFFQVKKEDPGSPVMQSIARSVREGAFAYLRRQYAVVSMVFVFLFIVLAALAFFEIQNIFTPVAFVIGGFWSGLAGFIGMNIATLASNRTAMASSHSLNRGLRVAFKSGAVMGLVVTSLALIDISAWFLILRNFVFTAEHLADGFTIMGITVVQAMPGLEEAAVESELLRQLTTCLVTFGLGASTQALFARVGGGIYTKAADVGADLVGKVEAGIPEDDPRNPATIADNVGDNVGDVAGMGADLYESYYGSIVATTALGAALGYQFVTGESGFAMADYSSVVSAPLVVAGLGIILSIVGIFTVRTKEGATQKDLLKSLLIGTGTSGVLIVVAVAVLAATGLLTWGLFGSVVSGLLAGVLIGQATEYYTSGEFRPTKGISDQARMGAAPAIIDGLALGMNSTALPVLFVAGAIIAAFGFAGGFGTEPDSLIAGLYGVSLAAVGMLSTLGITLATDAYGPIADNAGGNAEMAGLDPSVRERTDALDSLGNTTAATGKGFAIGSAALTALAMLASFVMMVVFWISKAVNTNDTGWRVFGNTAFHNTAGATAAQQAVTDGSAVRLADVSTVNIVDVMTAYNITLLNPWVIAGIFIGSMAAFVFAALTMKAVGRAAGAMVGEVRRQFAAIPGIMEYKPGDESPENKARTPQYAECVKIATVGAQREMLLPALLGIAIPVATGVVMGPAGVLGLLVGSLATGFCLATFLNNAGGAWDNAKKSVEAGRHGGKYLKNEAGEYVNDKGEKVEKREDAKNPIHGACVVGDTVGDPFKDTSGPALNILIKLMAIVSVVFSGLTVYGSLF